MTLHHAGPGPFDRINQLFDQLHEQNCATARFHDGYRQILRQHIGQIVNYPVRIGMLGKAGAGKSTLCNALFGTEVAMTGDVAACTCFPQELVFAECHGKGITLIDLPGIGANAERDAACDLLYRTVLPQLDLVLWLVKADDHALAVEDHFHHTLLQPLLQDNAIPVLFVLSQLDKTEPMGDWNWNDSVPGPGQHANIAAKTALLASRFGIPPSHLCTISAAQNYGLLELLEKTIRALINPGQSRAAWNS